MVSLALNWPQHTTLDFPGPISMLAAHFLDLVVPWPNPLSRTEPGPGWKSMSHPRLSQGLLTGKSQGQGEGT